MPSWGLHPKRVLCDRTDRSDLERMIDADLEAAVGTAPDWQDMPED
jgi:hypothetical protein